MDFDVPQDYRDLLASFRSFLDREVRPVEAGSRSDDGRGRSRPV